MSGEHLNHDLIERFDLLNQAEREPALRHATTCAACRRLLIAEDPSRLFALLGTEPVPQEILNRLSTRITEGIDRQDAARGVRRRRYAWGSLAASLLLVGVLMAGYLWTRPDVGEGQAAIPDHESAVDVPDEPEYPVSGIRVLSSPGEAQVLDLSVGEMQVVMIFDEELEI